MNNLSDKEWQETVLTTPNAIVIDVRTPEEWNEGIIENSLMLNIMESQTFANKLAELDKSKIYFVYCRSGARSTNACQYMSQKGFEHVTNLDGGVMSYSGDLVTPSAY
jgi:rhodanese-related sulfurtransferase